MKIRTRQKQMFDKITFGAFWYIEVKVGDSDWAFYIEDGEIALWPDADSEVVREERKAIVKTWRQKTEAVKETTK